MKSFQMLIHTWLATLVLASICLQTLTIKPACGQLLDAFRRLFHDPVVLAIDRGLEPGGDLANECLQIDELISTAEQARAILRAVKSLPVKAVPDSEAWCSPTYAVVSLFEQVEVGSEAEGILTDQGLHFLTDLYNELHQTYVQSQVNTPDASEALDDLICILSVQALYETDAGTALVVQAIREGLGIDEYAWYDVLTSYHSDNRQTQFLFDQLSSDIPDGNFALALLSHANALALELPSFRHPFRSPSGVLKLKTWISSSDPSDYENAQTATVALAFLDKPDQDDLLELAGVHPSHLVRLEAAWALAKAGDDRGLERLVVLCHDVHSAATAKDYLEELERTDLLPGFVNDPDFSALAEFSQWVQHPNELGRPPEKMEIIDRRTLPWVDSDEPATLTIVQYMAAGETILDPPITGTGLVGSMTWSFFSDEMMALPPEDVYAIHYIFEAENAGHLEDTELPLPEPERSDLLSQFTLGDLEDLFIEQAYTCDMSAGYPQKLVACGSASIEGKSGFAVFDGPRSRWYPANELPDDMAAWTVLRIHLGRQMLGFPLDTPRTLRSPPTFESPSPTKVTETYEMWLEEAFAAKEKFPADDDRLHLFDAYEPLGRFFTDYTKAKAEISGQDPTVCFIEHYERILKFARNAEPETREYLFDSYSIIGEQFESYVEAIHQTQPEKIATLIEELEPLWAYPYELCLLGDAALKCNMPDQALRLYESARQDDEESMIHTWPAAANLARLWFARGDKESAKSWLESSLEKCRTELSTTEYRYERDEFKLAIERLENTLHELFPD